MSNLWRKWYKVDELKAEIANLKKKVRTNDQVLMDSATDMSKLHEEVKELQKDLACCQESEADLADQLKIIDEAGDDE